LRACLAIIQPLDPGTGNRVTLRVSAHNDALVGRAVNGLDAERWEPAMVGAPVLRQSLFDGSFQSAAAPASASLPLAMETLKATWPDADTYAWTGAPVEIYSEDHTTAWPWTARFKGKVASFARAGQTLALSVAVDAEPFAADVLTATYAGTGGAEGGADLKGRAKPLVLGWALNVEPVLINAVDSVYQFSGYGPIEAVSTLYERGADYGAVGSDYANYAALVGAAVPPGGWATCLAEGMIRLGAPAYGVITADLKGHEISGSTPRRTGAFIDAICDLAGIDPSLVDGGSLTALDTAVARNVNLALFEQTNVLALAQRLALPCNAQAGIGIDGRLFVARVDFGATQQFVLDARGAALPQVTDSREDTVSPPFWRVVLGANRAWRVHTPEEIAFYAPLIDMGLWDILTVYREGNIVELADESRWLYVATTPSAGNVPQSGSAFWASLSGEAGISTERYPAAPPTDWIIGSIYYDIDNHPYRFEGLELYCGDEQLFCGAEPLLGSGYVSVRDRSLSAVIASLQSIDDDGVLTIDEKIRIVIPDNARLEAAYQGALARANLMGLNITPTTTARTAWIALRDSLSPAWDDTTQDTPIVRTDWDTILGAYRAAIESANTTVATPGGVVVVPPANQSVTVDADGAPSSGQYPRDLTPTVKRGDVDIRTDDGTSYSITTSGITATVNNTNGSANKGKITATAGTSGYIELTVTAGGVSFGPFRILFTKVGINQGSSTSMATQLPDGRVWTVRQHTAAANTAGTGGEKLAYGGDYEYTSYAHAWLSGGVGGANAQDNNPYVDYSNGGEELDGCNIASARDATCTVKLFAIGE
jgi:hypothetical protein